MADSFAVEELIEQSVIYGTQRRGYALATQQRMLGVLSIEFPTPRENRQLAVRDGTIRSETFRMFKKRRDRPLRQASRRRLILQAWDAFERMELL